MTSSPATPALKKCGDTQTARIVGDMSTTQNDLPSWVFTRSGREKTSWSSSWSPLWRRYSGDPELQTLAVQCQCQPTRGRRPRRTGYSVRAVRSPRGRPASSPEDVVAPSTRRSRRDEAAAGFLSLLSQAGAGVDERWFLLPHSTREPAVRGYTYRERVYTYELYHQLRTLSDTDVGVSAGCPPYTLSGEIDKAGLNAPIVGSRYKPDLLWHVPGEPSSNGVVVEIKAAASLRQAGIDKDLRTLAAMTGDQHRGYAVGVFLVFGPTRTDLRARVNRAAAQLSSDGLNLQRVQLFHHPVCGRKPLDLGSVVPCFMHR